MMQESRLSTAGSVNEQGDPGQSILNGPKPAIPSSRAGRMRGRWSSSGNLPSASAAAGTIPTTTPEQKPAGETTLMDEGDALGLFDWTIYIQSDLSACGYLHELLTGICRGRRWDA
jgi:hypothetical protein